MFCQATHRLVQGLITGWMTRTALMVGAGMVLLACTGRDEPSIKSDKIGSTSLCADSYLIALAPDRIGALSWQAGGALSTAPRTMTEYPRLWANREVLAQTKMGLVTGPGDPDFGMAKATALSWGEDFETVAANAAALSDQFDIDVAPLLAELSDLAVLPRRETPPRILYLSRSGGSAGPGTFVDAVIRAAGGINANATPGWHTPPIERTLGLQPDLIMTSFFGSNYAGISDRSVRHSALRRFLANHPRIDIPGKLWPCAGPGLIDATRQLNAAIMAL
jgi:iron complex transport system substrate-binding protein